MTATFSEAFPILYTTDVAAALPFYRDLLGFRETFRFPASGDPQYVALALGATALGIGMPPPHVEASDGRGRPRCELFLYTDDVDRAVAHLEAHGVPVRAAPADQPWGERNAYVEDPLGNPVHLATRL